MGFFAIGIALRKLLRLFEMNSAVSILIFAKGEVIKDDEGVSYDRNPIKRVKLDISTSYVSLHNIICGAMKIEASTSTFEIYHRYPMSASDKCGRVQHVLVPIEDDSDVKLLFEFALSNLGHIQQLYVTSVRSTNVEEVHPVVDCDGIGNARTSETHVSATNLGGSSVGGTSYGSDPILESIVQSDEEVDTDAEMFNMMENEEDACVQNEEGSNTRVEKPLPFYVDRGGDGRMTFDGVGKGRVSDELEPESDFKKGMRFRNKHHLIQTVKTYHIKNHHNYEVAESDRRLWSVFCADEEKGCKWRLRAIQRKYDDEFEVTIVGGPHTCLNVSLSRDHTRLDANFMAPFFRTFVRETPDVKVSVLRSVIQEKFGYDVSRRRAWDAKKKAIEIEYGDWDQSYNELPHLLNAIKASNSGTVVDWGSSYVLGRNEVTFEKVFWSFGPSIEAFKHCRPIISIDATFLYGKYKQKLLIACSMDGMNHIVPLAFAIVDEESYDSWSWFLKCLKHYVVADRCGPFCLISDRHSGIEAAVTDVNVGWCPPFAQWRHCIRHVASNFNTRFRNTTCKRLLVKAASKSTKHKFKRIMAKLLKSIPEAGEFFDEMSKEQWALSYDGFYRYGMMTTNLSESYNSVIRGARSLPVSALVRKTFYNCAGYFIQRRDEATLALNNGKSITEIAIDKLARARNKAKYFEVILLDREEGHFSVRTRGGVKHVYLNNGTCSCKKWQILRLPCSHSLAAFAFVHVDSTQRISKWYTWNNQIEVYAGKFTSFDCREDWPELRFPAVLPDSSRIRQKGRPRSTRIHNEMDVKERSYKSTCGICRQEGHNRRRCPRK